MCGIVGYAGRTPVQVEHFVASRDTMAHRGPDDAGVFCSSDRTVVLAHRRLAIIDLSPAGHQPMCDGVGRDITFNGEIYNYLEVRDRLASRGHSFKTSTDTEVILAAYREWETDCVKNLNGMFAFAIYDRERRRLFLARDRAGEKPLYYSARASSLFFASELKALMALPDFERTLDLESLDHYLAYGYVPRDRCILRGVRKLPAGSALTFDLETGALKDWPYWSLPTSADDESASESDLVAELESLLEAAVRRQLVAADVPVGILLSGGMDSSLITAMAARTSTRPLRTFTVSFPGHRTYDEAPFARRVAQHFGTDHHELVAEEASVELLPALARQYDEPLADSSMIPTYLVSKLIRQHATVALGGDGGDELFGGYPHYRWLEREDRLRRFAPRALRALVASGAERLLPLGVYGRNRLLGFRDATTSIAQVNMYFDRRNRARLVIPDGYESWRSPEELKKSLCPPSGSVSERAAVVDFMTYLTDDILMKVDRASMLSSLEIRAPFLDPAVIEFAFGRVPSHLRATARGGKILLRRLAKRVLPPDLDLTRKQGFSIPLHTWFGGPFGDFMRAVLAEANPHLFDQRVIDELVEGQRRGRSNGQRLFALTMFELWRREYDVHI